MNPKLPKSILAIRSRSTQKMTDNTKRCVLVCQYESCRENGSAETLAAFSFAEVPKDVTVIGTDCQGQCSSGPTVRIIPEETWYCRVKPTDVPSIVEQHLKKGKRVARKLHPRIHIQFG